MAAISITTLAAAYTQDFDTLANAAGTTNNVLSIPGWSLTETGGGARDNEQYAVDTGASNSGDTYSYGAAAAADRALGSIRSGSLNPVFGVNFSNDTGQSVASLLISYAGEQWRLGTLGRPDRLDFQYSLDAADLATGTWTDVDALDFLAPVSTGAVGALDGNLAANQTALSFTITGLAIANGSQFWLRWTDPDATGGDDGLAVDNFSLTAQGAPVAPSVTISDASVSEGDAGTKILSFTVTRSGGTDAFAIDYATADGTGTAGSDYVASNGTLSFAAGETTQTIEVTINGDAAVEPNETFFVNLSNPSNGALVADGQGLGTITNDDFTLTTIMAIQGAGHRSPFVGGTPADATANSGAARVSTEGVVTAISNNGFWIQDATGDGDVNTSDAVFVFTGSTNFPSVTSTVPAGVTVGERVRVTDARVDEFRAAANNLSVTQLNVTVAGAGVVQFDDSNAVAPVLIGAGGRIPPANFSDPGLATFDPTQDVLDFWETLEGMAVQIDAPKTVSNTAEFRTRSETDPSNAAGAPNEEIWVTAPGGFDAGNLSSRGALVINAADQNPERIQLDDILPSVDLPTVNVGATLGSVRGVVNYDFGSYEVLVGSAAQVLGGGVPTVATPSPLAPDATTLAAGSPSLAGLRQLTVGNYNVENLDVTVESSASGAVPGSDLFSRLANVDDDAGSGKLAAHAKHIVSAMGAPTVVTLQEIQDDDGGTISAALGSDAVLQALVDAIAAAGGPAYSFAYLPPAAVNADGGQPNANIRQAFLYRSDMVQLVSLTRLTDPDAAETDRFAGDDFAASRKPLVGVFSMFGTEFTLINNHLNSKGGDDNLAGNRQPPVLSSELQRIEQARIINDYVDSLLAADPNRPVLVAGDLNDFTFSNPVRVLTGELAATGAALTPGTAVLTDLADALLPANERYSYVFNGNAQELDHMLASNSLLTTAAAEFDIVHVNSEFSADFAAANPVGASDHDPTVARFTVSNLSETLNGTTGADTILGLGGNDTINGGDGADWLLGGAGVDSLLGQAGDDVLIGDGVVPYTANAAAVTRLYNAAFGRGPDDGGLIQGVGRLDGGATVQTYAGDLAGSPEFQAIFGGLTNAQFVARMYTDVLERTPDAGAAGWVALLDGGGTRGQVLAGFAESQEFRAATDPTAFAGQILRLYDTAFNRLPDIGGFTAAFDARSAGATLTTTATAFLASPEFANAYGSYDNTQFVIQLYINALNRLPDGGGLNAWVGALNAGASRAEVLARFSESQEHVNLSAAPLDAFMDSAAGFPRDVLAGGAGVNSLTGGRGADSYVFDNADDATTTVYGFESFESLRFVGFGFATPAEALAAMTQQGADVVFASQGDTVVFAGTRLATLQQLQASDWQLV